MIYNFTRNDSDNTWIIVTYNNKDSNNNDDNSDKTVRRITITLITGVRIFIIKQ